MGEHQHGHGHHRVIKRAYLRRGHGHHGHHLFHRRGLHGHQPRWRYWRRLRPSRAPWCCARAPPRRLRTAGGGTWASSNAAVATVAAGTGVVAGTGGGTAVVTYTIGDGCMATAAVTVNPVAAIAGAAALCQGGNGNINRRGKRRVVGERQHGRGHHRHLRQGY